VEEQPRIGSSDELLQQVFGLPGASFDIYRAQNRDNIFQQEFGIISSASRQPLLSRSPSSSRPLLTAVFGSIRIQEFKDP